MASAWTPSLVLTGGFWSGLFSVEVSPGMKGMSCPFVACEGPEGRLGSFRAHRPGYSFDP